MVVSGNLPFSEHWNFVGFKKALYCRILKRVLIKLEVNSLVYFKSHLSVKVPVVEMFFDIFINFSSSMIWKDPQVFQCKFSCCAYKNLLHALPYRQRGSEMRLQCSFFPEAVYSYLRNLRNSHRRLFLTLKGNGSPSYRFCGLSWW